MGQFQKVWHKHNWNARRRKENRREEMSEKEFLKIIDKYQTTNPKTQDHNTVLDASNLPDLH